jgi:hypothetical protein
MRRLRRLRCARALDQRRPRHQRNQIVIIPDRGSQADGRHLEDIVHRSLRMAIAARLMTSCGHVTGLPLACNRGPPFFGPERCGLVPRLTWAKIVFGWHARRLDPNNLQVLCNDCNMGKGSWDQTDFRTPDMRLRLSDSLRKSVSSGIEFFVRAITLRGREKVPEEDG